MPKSKDKQRIKELEEQVKRLTVELAYIKKIGGLNSRTEEPRKEELARAITELRQELRLSVKYIIDVINANPGLPHISRSNYYYQTHKPDKDSGNQKLMDRIKEIFLEHSRRYGYRRIYGQLRREVYEINHKKVQRLMQKMGLFAISIRKKRKYSSYYGVQGKIKPDLIKRNFYAIIPDRHWFTDVTEFHLKDQKFYLSPIIDGCTQEIISYNISRHPDLKQVMTMLNDAFEKHPALNGLIFHSDRGWQYQHQAYQAALANRGIDQSMSRLGNSLDDGLMEGFFGILKREMFYGQEHKYKDLNELEQAIHKYIDYYNNVRIKAVLDPFPSVDGGFELAGFGLALSVSFPAQEVSYLAGSRPGLFNDLDLLVISEIDLVAGLLDDIGAGN
ncbi:IS3 family transposase [Lactobacillus delbrueckii]|uniref:IS3 family transposase n=1 Tax=Lactobacillus delbrueckii TaxID=1584 RepID=UPI0035565D1F